jgi:uncharacterized membrane protein required for colicin V production
LIIDIALAALLIFAIAQGFNRGLLPTLFQIVGYLGGGGAGLLVAKELSGDWQGLVSIIALYLISIFTGAQLGRWAMGKIGSGFHKRILFGPFKFLDSILGGLLALIQIAIFAAIVLTVIDYLPWSVTHELIEQSRIYEYVSGLNLLSFPISDLLKSVSSHLDQLRS